MSFDDHICKQLQAQKFSTKSITSYGQTKDRWFMLEETLQVP